MEIPTVEEFLINYEKRFSDYASYIMSIKELKRLNKNTNEIDYHDICFSTAEALYDILSNKCIIKNGKIEDIINNINDKIVIYIKYMMSSGESHALCIFTLPEIDEVVVVQSIGGIYKASHEYFDKNLFKTIINNFSDNDDPITHLGNSHPKEITSINISKCKDININLLPKFTVEEEKYLKFERYYWLLNYFAFSVDIPKDYDTKRTPDIREYYIQLHNLNISDNKFTKDLEKFKSDIIWEEYHALRKLIYM